MNMILVALIATFLLFLGLFISYISFKKVRNWFNNNKKKAVAIIVSGGIVTAGIVFLPPGDVVKNPIPVAVDMPYLWVEPHGYGTFGYWKLNETFYRNWLNNTVSWKVEKSTDGIKWTDYKKFIIKKDWDTVNLSEKHTIIVTADEDAYYRILTNTKSDKQLLSYTDDSKNTSFSMRFKVSESKDYTLLYNWSDYSKSPEASKTVLSKSIKTDVLSSKQYFEWMVVSSSKLKKDEVFTVDPVYGTIGNAATDSWEWDAEEGIVNNPLALCKIGNSEYYVTSAAGDTGSDTDGFLRTFQVNDADGTFVESVISTWEYDISDGYAASIVHISGNVYAVVYFDFGGSCINAFTTTIWDTNGTLKKNTIDSITVKFTASLFPVFFKVTGNIYGVLFQEASGGYDHWLVTIGINSDGSIDNAVKDSWEFDTTSNADAYNTVYGAMVDSDTLAVVWGESAGDDGWLATVNISSAGVITKSWASSWEWDISLFSSNIYSLYIHHIAGNVFAILYCESDVTGWCKTVTIADTGLITKSFIDTLKFDTANYYYGMMFTVNDASSVSPGVYGVTYQGTDGDGFVCTTNITSAGSIDATVNDKLEFDTVDNIFYAPCVHVADNFYLIVYTSTGNDGWAKTVTIETYEAPASWSNVCPIAKGEHPTNNSANVALQVACGATISDGNSNHTMNVTFATNRSGSWVNKQTNSSVANNSKVNWTYGQANSASTKYWWRVYVHDGKCNQSFTYSFTTKANATGGTIYQETIRNSGVDYFTYLGGNITINSFEDNITGFDEAGESLAIWKNGTWNAINGAWQMYYGDGTGTDFTLHTFDVIRVNLTDAGTQIINMSQNTFVNYTNSKTYQLRNLSVNKGYNFSGYNRVANTLLSTINTTGIGLETGEFLALWNETNYDWDIWISGFGFTDKVVHTWDVIMTKIENNEVWTT